MLKKVFLRCGVILFWIALIAGALYWPEEGIPPLEERSLNVFAWGDILDPSIIAEFEKKSGIRVHLNYFASNEELIVKLKATKGEGYDLIFPSDYSVQILRKEGLLKELDRTKLSFYNHLNPTLLNHEFDPKNRYSIPWSWELFVIGIDKTFFETHPLDPSWKMLYDSAMIDYRITVINDPVQSMLLGSFYLFGVVDHVDQPELNRIVDLLVEQKKHVAAYADFRADYFLATKNCPVVLSTSAYIWRTMRKFDFVSYVIPKEGTFLSMENISIPAASDKEPLAYELINYLYQPQSMKTHYDTFGFFPVTLDVLPLLDIKPGEEKLLSASPEVFEKFHFTKVVASQEEIRDAWIRVKSR